MADNLEKQPQSEEPVEATETVEVEGIDTQDGETGKKAKSDRKEKKAQKQLDDAKKAIEALEAEKAALNDTYVRMLAEYDNFRKRAAREKDAMYAEGISDAVEKLLPVLDNLERAAATDPEASDAKSILDGVKKVLEQANECFTKLGVSEIEAQGQTFDPELHNAVMHEENEDYAENVISDVFMKGYKLGDKVIRHSVVKVMN